MGNETDIAVLKNQLEQIIDKLSDVCEALHKSDERVRELELEVNDINNITKINQKEIEETRSKLKEVNNRAWGAIITIITGIIIAILKVGLGI